MGIYYFSIVKDGSIGGINPKPIPHPAYPDSIPCELVSDIK